MARTFITGRTSFSTWTRLMFLSPSYSCTMCERLNAGVDLFHCLMSSKPTVIPHHDFVLLHPTRASTPIMLIRRAVCKYPQSITSYESCPEKVWRSVSDLLEVLAQLGDAVEGVGCLDVGGVVRNQERLGGLVGYDAFLALSQTVSIVASITLGCV